MAGFSFVSGDENKPVNLNKKMPFAVVIGIIVAIIAVVLALSSFTVVSEGFVGVKYRFGRIESANLQAGLNFKIPFVENIVQVDIREQIYTDDTDAYTRDTQTVESLLVKLNYYYDQNELSSLIRNVGIENVEARYIIPHVQSIVKNEISQFRAEELIQNRVVVQTSIEEKLRENLESSGIIVASFALENINFEEGFEEAVRAKVVAEQDALTMQNRTREREEEAAQRVIAAEAEAEAARLQADAEAYAIERIQEQLNSSPQYLDYVKLQQWNGELPQAIGETINPFVVLDDEGTVASTTDE